VDDLNNKKIACIEYFRLCARGLRGTSNLSVLYFEVDSCIAKFYHILDLIVDDSILFYFFNFLYSSVACRPH
jgi:hypothetical protein